jgi:hypothetical protein
LEGSRKVPVFSGGGFTVVRLTRTSDNSRLDFPLIDTIASLPVTATNADYRVTVENLPGNYTLKSMTSGSIDLMKEPLTVKPSSTTSNNLTTTVQLLQLGLLAASSAAAPIAPVIVTISVTQPAPGTGVRVTGQSPLSGSRSVYLSGTPGIFYYDGSFEVRNVPPGRHFISVSADNPGTA